MTRQDRECNPDLLTPKEKEAVETLRAAVKALPRSLRFSIQQMEDGEETRPMLWAWKPMSPGDEGTRDAVANMPIRM